MTQIYFLDLKDALEAEFNLGKKELFGPLSLFIFLI